MYCYSGIALKGKHGFWKLSANAQAILKVFHTQDIEYSEILFPVCICCGPWLQRAPLCTQCDFFNYFFKITFTYRVQRVTLGFFFFGSANYLSRTKQKHDSSCAALFRNDTWKGLFLLQAPRTAGFSAGYYTWRWCELNSSADRSKWQDRQKWKSGVSLQSKFKVCCAPAL